MGCLSCHDQEWIKMHYVFTIKYPEKSNFWEKTFVLIHRPSYSPSWWWSHNSKSVRQIASSHSQSGSRVQGIHPCWCLACSSHLVQFRFLNKEMILTTIMNDFSKPVHITKIIFQTFSKTNCNLNSLSQVFLE